MEQVSMIEIDLAKNSFQLHGARLDGSVAFRKKLSRAKVLGFLASQQPCTVAMEACGGAHHWGRETAKQAAELWRGPSSLHNFAYRLPAGIAAFGSGRGRRRIFGRACG